jgi:HD-like signal output (HDOD) protein
MPGSAPEATPTKRVLLVDADPLALTSLSVALERARWQVSTAPDDVRAEELLVPGAFDVVLVDLGPRDAAVAALLERAKLACPEAARVLHARGAPRLARALAVAHQAIAKPCPPDMLIGMLERLRVVQQLVHDERLRAVMSGIGKLPQVSQTYVQLGQIESSASGNFRAVAEVAGREPALCAKLLQVANSAFFGLGRKVASLDEAVALLGLSAVRDLALSAQFLALLEGVAQVPGLRGDLLQRHARLAGRIARRLADKHIAREAFTAALLQDLGRLVLAAGRPTELTAIIARHAAGGSLVDAELALLGATHAQVGAYLLGLWGVAPTLVEAVALHHAPRPRGAGGLDFTAITHVAGALADEALGRVPGISDGEIDVARMSVLGLDDDLVRLRAIAKEELTSPDEG